MPLAVRPLTPDLWPALEDLFGAKGACNGCWCMYWRIGAAYHKRPREQNKTAFHEIVNSGPPPGLIAFEDQIPVGWVQITPRDAVSYLDLGKIRKRVDDVPVWSMSCFYVRVGYRKRGIMTALIRAAVDYATSAGAPAIEAYPVFRKNGASFTGYPSSFKAAGFKTVESRNPSRPIMRRQLQVR